MRTRCQNWTLEVYRMLQHFQTNRSENLPLLCQPVQCSVQCSAVQCAIPCRERGVVPDLVMSGALAHLDNLHVDWTRDSDTSDANTADIKNLETLMLYLTSLSTSLGLRHVPEVSPSCTCEVNKSLPQVTSTDDETYSSFNGSLPSC
jgi:hypothetical protein